MSNVNCLLFFLTFYICVAHKIHLQFELLFMCNMLFTYFSFLTNTFQVTVVYLCQHSTGFLCFLQTGVFAVHVFGAQNLYLDANFPPEHYGIYVQITVGSTTKCTSLQSPLKKGRVVWDEIRNFPVAVSFIRILELDK